MTGKPTPCEKCGQVHARCKAHRRDGNPCGQPPITGLAVCRMHGGRTPVAVAKAKERTIEAALRGEMTKRGWEPVTDPLTAYADLAGEVWAWKELCREKASELAGWEHVDGNAGVDLRPTIAVYERAQERASKTLHDMLRLGLDHEALRQARERPTREQAEGLSRIIDRLLDALHLTDQQRAAVPDALADAIRQEMTK